MIFEFALSDFEDNDIPGDLTTCRQCPLADWGGQPSPCRVLLPSLPPFTSNDPPSDCGLPFPPFSSFSASTSQRSHTVTESLLINFDIENISQKICLICPDSLSFGQFLWDVQLGVASVKVDRGGSLNIHMTPDTHPGLGYQLPLISEYHIIM